MSSMFLRCNIQYVYMFVHMGPLPVFPLLKTHLFGDTRSHINQPNLIHPEYIYIYIWLAVSTPLKKYESQLGWLFPIYGKHKKKKCWNHQPGNQICVFWLKMRYPQIHWFLRQTQRSNSWLYIPAKSHCGCLTPIFVYSLFLLYHSIPSSSIILTIIPHTIMVICSVISPYIPMIPTFWIIVVDWFGFFAVSSKPIPSIIGRALKAALIAVVALTQYSVE